MSARRTDKEVLNAQEASELLGVSAWTIRELAHQGRLPGQKIGREWRFSRTALLNHLSDTWTGARDREQAAV